MTFGYRDDVAVLPMYIDKGFEARPVRDDEVGVGPLVDMAVEKGRAAKPSLAHLCEHRRPSVKFCHRVGLDYSPVLLPYHCPVGGSAGGH